MPDMAAQKLCVSIGLVAFTAIASTSAHAQESVADFYRGKTVNMIIASAPGGGYDTYGRIVARHIGKYIPGQPTVVPQNLPGAGGTTAATHVYKIAPKDGTFIGAIHPSNILEPILNPTMNVQYDPQKFIYIGSANSDAYVCYVRRDAATKFEDATKKEILLGAQSVSTSTYTFPTLLNSVLGTKFKVITGYTGNREIFAAIEKGELQGQCGAGWMSVSVPRPDWFRDDTSLVSVIAQESLKGHPDLDKKGIPRALDMVKTDAQKRSLELLYSMGVYGRPFVVAPEVPKDRVDALRAAFMKTFEDKEFITEAERMKLDVLATPGEEIQALIQKIYKTPEDVVKSTRKALGH
jgi:tripartite-type tricarboxylate transporter receptor subunit TctC